MSISRLSLAAFAFVAALSGTARADVLSTPPLYHPDQKHAYCMLFNQGAPAINFLLVRLMRSDGAIIPPKQNSCNGSLAPNKQCFVHAEINNLVNPVCKVVTTNGAVNLRGSLTIRKATLDVLQSADLR